MTRDLAIIIFSIFAFILIIYFIIKIYASWKIERLYEDLTRSELLHSHNAYSNFSLTKKYLDVVFFRNSYYHFLSKYLRCEKLEYHRYYFKRVLPDICKNIDKDYLSDLFKRC